MQRRVGGVQIFGGHWERAKRERAINADDEGGGEGKREVRSRLSQQQTGLLPVEG